MITVVIPMLNQIKYTTILLDSISNNVVRPERIIIIDDGGSDNLEPLTKRYVNLNLEIIRHNETKGVNYSWNEGVSKTNTELVSVLNNDIIVNPLFFKKILEAHKQSESWGIVCPFTVDNENLSYNKERVRLKSMVKREGWAWTARMSFMKRVKPIPSILKTHFGDDYIFYCAKKLGYNTFKIMNNEIYHYASKTLLTTTPMGGGKEVERKQWNKLLTEMENGHFDIESKPD